MNSKLYRSRTDYRIAGVCGGLGAYLEVDSSLIRLFFILLTISGGAGVLLYLLLWVLIPYPEQTGLTPSERFESGVQELADQARSLGETPGSGTANEHQRSALAIGLALVVLGLFFLAQHLGVWWPRWPSGDLVWPVLLIIAGAALLWRRLGGSPR